MNEGPKAPRNQPTKERTMQKTIKFERYTIRFNKGEWSAVKAAKAATKANHLNLVRHDAVTVKQLDRNSKIYRAAAKKPFYQL